MKKTILQIVQDVLNDLDDDYVNSINDTEESQQIAAIVASTYQAMMSSRNWPHTKRTINLVPSTNNLLPTHMSLETDIKELVSVYYDRRRSTDTNMRYERIKWREPDDFLRYTYGRNSSSDIVMTVDDPSGIKLLIINNTGPTYFTSFDDTTLVFDSWDNGIDSTLQASKSVVTAYIIPDFTLEDSFIPDLPDEAFSALIEEVKSKAAYKIKQAPDQKSEQESKRQQSWLSRKDWRVHGGIHYPNYGRRRNRYHYKDATFRQDND